MCVTNWYRTQRGRDGPRYVAAEDTHIPKPLSSLGPLPLILFSLFEIITEVVSSNDSHDRYKNRSLYVTRIALPVVHFRKRRGDEEKSNNATQQHQADPA